MKNYSVQNITGSACIQLGGTIRRAVTRLISLLIISFFCVCLPSLGHGTEDPLTPEERAWLTLHDGKLIVNNEAGWPPIIDRDKDGNSFGIVIDYQRLIEKKLGFKFKLDKPDIWENFMERFRKGEIDVNNNLQKNPKRTEYALFTNPYIEIPNAIIVRKETKGALILEKMRDMKIAVTREFAIHDYIINNFEYLNIIPVENDLTCLLETATKGVDAAVVNLAVASYIIEKEGIVNLRIAGYAEYKNALCFASRKDLPILNLILEKGLGLITPKERDGIYRKWIALGYVPFYRSRIFWIITCGATAVIIVFGVLIIGWNRSLKRQVQIRTEKLEDTNIQLKGEIDDRKKAEAAYKDSEFRYRSLIEHSSDVVFCVDRNGEYKFVNQVFASTFGKTPDYFLGKTFWDIYPKEHADYRQAASRRVFEAGESQSVEVVVPLPDRTLYFLAKANPVRDETGEVVLNLTHATDITERKKAEAALQESEKKFRLIAENTADLISILDMNMRFTYVSPGIMRLRGFTVEEAMAQTLDQILTPESMQIALAAFEQEMIMESGGTADPDRTRILELEEYKKDGTTVCAEVSLSFLRDKDHMPVEILGVTRDITERKRAEKEKAKLEAQLRQAQKFEAIGTLAGGLAHDFNNLLMGIQGRASLLSLELETSNPHWEHINAIEDYIRSATNLTKQLLGFARGGKYEVKPIDMNKLVLDSSAMFGRTKKEIRIHTKCQKSTLTVEADRGQIEQVLLNMYVNAWQAIPPEGGELYLETKIVTLEEAYCKPHQTNPGRYVKVTITDTGAGMDEATRLQIFDPFFTTKEKGRGTGLGLASSYGIIKNHGGMITVYSELGHGTTFNIYLPASDKNVRQDVSMEGRLIKGSETILLVDDEEMITEVGQAMLEKLGYRVVVAKGGQEAIKVITDMGAEIDLLILDMIMPGMDGGTTFDSIRKIQSDMPVILSSGYAINGQADKIMRKGCNGFIQKPYNISELSQKIRKILDDAKRSSLQ